MHEGHYSSYLISNFQDSNHKEGQQIGLHSIAIFSMSTIITQCYLQ